MAGETVLVVDDGAENREFVVEYVLEPNGFRALVAKDGREGTKSAIDNRPDLILLDLQMPRMNGIEVLHALHERNIDIPVILMTFHGSEEIAVEVYRLGVRDYVKKPYSVDEMLQAIERSLSEARLQKEKQALIDRLTQANRELQQRVSELNILYATGKTVTSTMDMDQLLPHIVNAACQITNAEEGRLFLMTEQRGIVNRAQKRHNAARAEKVDQVVKSQAVAHVLSKGEPLLLTREQLGNRPDSPICVAYAPLLLRKKAIGVLSVSNINDSSHIFSPHETALLSALTDYAAIAIDNSRNFEALRKSQEQEKQQIRDTFERFVPPSIVDKVLDDPEELQLGGTRQEISVLFADIRGYTAWSEKVAPEQVMEILNDYLSLAAEVILAWEGTLDKYFGDGVMAIFNAPVEQKNHTHRATDAALALLQAAQDLNERKGYDLAYSIGINVGQAVVGYIGTERALNYTAIGDTVNLAKRLQENARPGQILVEEAVVHKLDDYATCRPLGELRLRNRKQPAQAYLLEKLRPIYR